MSTSERQKIDKAVRDLDHKKLVRMLHQEFREFDRTKETPTQQKQKQSDLDGSGGSGILLNDDLSTSQGNSRSAFTSTGIINKSIVSAVSGTSSIGPHALSMPPTDISSVKDIIDEIAWQKRSQKMQSIVRSQSNFSMVLSKAREEISRLPFAQMRHSASFTSFGGVSDVFHPPLSPRDRSKHFVGEFGDQWFENDKPALKRLLSIKTRTRTRFERDEFLEACNTAAGSLDKMSTLSTNITPACDVPATSKSQFGDPKTDGRLMVYDMLRATNGKVLKRKLWKSLRSNTKSVPFLDACPGLAPLSGRPTLRWSSAAGHDKPLPKRRVICNAEAKGAIINRKNVLLQLEKEYNAVPDEGLTITEQNIRQELKKSIHFYKNEISRLHEEVPSVQRKRLATIEARRLAAVQARKDAAMAKKLESKRMQEQKATKAARAAVLSATLTS